MPGCGHDVETVPLMTNMGDKLRDEVEGPCKVAERGNSDGDPLYVQKNAGSSQLSPCRMDLENCADTDCLSSDSINLHVSTDTSSLSADNVDLDMSTDTASPSLDTGPQSSRDGLISVDIAELSRKPASTSKESKSPEKCSGIADLNPAENVAQRCESPQNSTIQKRLILEKHEDMPDTEKFADEDCQQRASPNKSAGRDNVTPDKPVGKVSSSPNKSTGRESASPDKRSDRASISPDKLVLRWSESPEKSASGPVMECGHCFFSTADPGILQHHMQNTHLQHPGGHGHLTDHSDQLSDRGIELDPGTTDHGLLSRAADQVKANPLSDHAVTPAPSASGASDEPGQAKRSELVDSGASMSGHQSERLKQDESSLTDERSVPSACSGSDAAHSKVSSGQVTTDESFSTTSESDAQKSSDLHIADSSLSRSLKAHGSHGTQHNDISNDVTVAQDSDCNVENTKNKGSSDDITIAKEKDSNVQTVSLNVITPVTTVTTTNSVPLQNTFKDQTETKNQGDAKNSVKSVSVSMETRNVVETPQPAIEGATSTSSIATVKTADQDATAKVTASADSGNFEQPDVASVKPVTEVKVHAASKSRRSKYTEPMNMEHVMRIIEEVAAYSASLGEKKPEENDSEPLTDVPKKPKPKRRRTDSSQKNRKKNKTCQLGDDIAQSSVPQPDNNCLATESVPESRHWQPCQQTKSAPDNPAPVAGNMYPGHTGIQVNPMSNTGGAAVDNTAYTYAAPVGSTLPRFDTFQPQQGQTDILPGLPSPGRQLPPALPASPRSISALSPLIPPNPQPPPTPPTPSGGSQLPSFQSFFVRPYQAQNNTSPLSPTNREPGGTPVHGTNPQGMNAGCMNMPSNPVHQHIASGPFQHSTNGSYQNSAIGTYQNNASETYQNSASGAYQNSASGTTYQNSAGGTYQNSASETYQNSASGAYQNNASGAYQNSAGGNYQNSAGGTYQNNASGATYQNSAGGTYQNNASGAYQNSASGSYPDSASRMSQNSLESSYNNPQPYPVPVNQANLQRISTPQSTSSQQSQPVAPSTGHSGKHTDRSSDRYSALKGVLAKKNEDIPIIYSCSEEECIYMADSRAEFMSHVVHEHPRARLYYCPYCPLVATSTEAIAKHRKQQHPNDANMSARELGHGADAALNCRFCHFITSDPVTFRHHEQSCQHRNVGSTRTSLGLTDRWTASETRQQNNTNTSGQFAPDVSTVTTRTTSNTVTTHVMSSSSACTTTTVSGHTTSCVSGQTMSNVSGPTISGISGPTMNNVAELTNLSGHAVNNVPRHSLNCAPGNVMSSSPGQTRVSELMNIAPGHIVNSLPGQIAAPERTLVNMSGHCTSVHGNSALPQISSGQPSDGRIVTENSPQFSALTSTVSSPPNRVKIAAESLLQFAEVALPHMQNVTMPTNAQSQGSSKDDNLAIVSASWSQHSQPQGTNMADITMVTSQQRQQAQVTYQSSLHQLVSEKMSEKKTVEINNAKSPSLTPGGSTSQTTIVTGSCSTEPKNSAKKSSKRRVTSRTPPKEQAAVTSPASSAEACSSTELLTELPPPLPEEMSSPLTDASQNRKHRKGYRPSQRNSHLKANKFVCNHCPFRGINMNAIKRHVLQVHTDLRPYTCPYCDYGHVEEYEIKRHIIGKQGRGPGHQGKEVIVKKDTNLINELNRRAEEMYTRLPVRNNQGHEATEPPTNQAQQAENRTINPDDMKLVDSSSNQGELPRNTSTSQSQPSVRLTVTQQQISVNAPAKQGQPSVNTLTNQRQPSPSEAAIIQRLLTLNTPTNMGTQLIQTPTNQGLNTNTGTQLKQMPTNQGLNTNTGSQLIQTPTNQGLNTNTGTQLKQMPTNQGLNTNTGSQLIQTSVNQGLNTNTGSQLIQTLTNQGLNTNTGSQLIQSPTNQGLNTNTGLQLIQTPTNQGLNTHTGSQLIQTPTNQGLNTNQSFNMASFPKKSSEMGSMLDGAVILNSAGQADGCPVSPDPHLSSTMVDPVKRKQSNEAVSMKSVTSDQNVIAKKSSVNPTVQSNANKPVNMASFPKRRISDSGVPPSVVPAAVTDDARRKSAGVNMASFPKRAAPDVNMASFPKRTPVLNMASFPKKSIIEKLRNSNIRNETEQEMQQKANQNVLHDSVRDGSLIDRQTHQKDQDVPLSDSKTRHLDKDLKSKMARMSIARSKVSSAKHNTKLRMLQKKNNTRKVNLAGRLAGKLTVKPNAIKLDSGSELVTESKIKSDVKKAKSETEARGAKTETNMSISVKPRLRTDRMKGDITNDWLSSGKEQENFSCKNCPYRTNFLSCINRHVMLQHINIRPFMCGYCSYKNIDTYEVKRHILRCHRGQPIKVNVNHVKKVDLENINTHEWFNVRSDSAQKRAAKTSLRKKRKSENLDDELESGVSEKYMTDSGIKTPEQGAAPAHNADEEETFYGCKECEFRTTMLYQINAHVQKHINDICPYSCPMCPFRSCEAEEVRQHILREHQASKRIRINTQLLWEQKQMDPKAMYRIMKGSAEDRRLSGGDWEALDSILSANSPRKSSPSHHKPTPHRKRQPSGKGKTLGQQKTPRSRKSSQSVKEKTDNSGKELALAEQTGGESKPGSDAITMSPDPDQPITSHSPVSMENTVSSEISENVSVNDDPKPMLTDQEESITSQVDDSQPTTPLPKTEIEDPIKETEIDDSDKVPLVLKRKKLKKKKKRKHANLNDPKLKMKVLVLLKDVHKQGEDSSASDNDFSYSSSSEMLYTAVKSKRNLCETETITTAGNRTERTKSAPEPLISTPFWEKSENASLNRDATDLSIRTTSEMNLCDAACVDKLDEEGVCQVSGKDERTTTHQSAVSAPSSGEQTHQSAMSAPSSGEQKQITSSVTLQSLSESKGAVSDSAAH